MTEAEKLILQTWEDEAVKALLGSYDRAAERCGVTATRVAEVVGENTKGWERPGSYGENQS